MIMQRLFGRLAPLCLLVTSLTSGTLRAQEPEINPEFQWLRDLHLEMEASWTHPPKKPSFVVGNNVWQPGKRYAAGADWRALACDSKGCSIEPAELKVKRKSWQGHYDDYPTHGQQLNFRQTGGAKANVKVVAWFRTGPAWLKPGEITAYYTGVGKPRTAEGRGTMEALIETPDGARSVLVPMLLETYEAEMQTALKSYGQDVILLQLRADGKRQMLPGILGACSHQISGTGYLLWSGDLDRDGKPDYLISYVDADGPVHLYLSSKAKPKQIVGLAALYNAPPYGGECDG
jgi:hypothetical protein